MITLLNKAKSLQTPKLRTFLPENKEEIDLLFSYINGEIDTNQVGYALGCSQSNAYNKLGAIALRYLKSEVIKKKK